MAKITHEITVWCDCGEWHQDGARICRRTVRRMGWKLTRANGWVCPRCVEAAKLPPKAEP